MAQCLSIKYIHTLHTHNNNMYTHSVVHNSGSIIAPPTWQ